MRIIESFKFIELKNSIISNTSSNAFQEAYNVLSNQEKKHVEWLFPTKKVTSAHTLLELWSAIDSCSPQRFWLTIAITEIKKMSIII